MKNCGEIIEREINRKRVLRREISEYVGISAQNLSKVLRKDSLDADLLEKFCEYLDLDPADFFDFRPAYAGGKTNIGKIDQDVILGDATVNFHDAEVALMNKLIDEKDARIASLESTVELLRSIIEKSSDK